MELHRTGNATCPTNLLSIPLATAVAFLLFAGSSRAQSSDPSAGVGLSDNLQRVPAHPADPTHGVAIQPVSTGTVNTYSVGDNAIDFTPGSGLCGSNQGQTIGWQFDLAVPITVSAMTWYDDGQDGLELDHEVGIWDPSGALVATTHVIIPAGTAAPLDGIWRTVAIAPTVLPAGSGYIVGGYNGDHSECLSFDVVQVPDSSIVYFDANFSDVNGVFERPTNNSAAINGFYGVSFQVTDGAPSEENAVDFDVDSGLCGSNSAQTIGWAFDVVNPVTITSMSWFDSFQDGLEVGHEVGIFAPDGTLIPETNVVIPAGTGAELDGIWRTVSIPPTTLPVGAGYIVGGYNGAHGECLNFNVSQTVHPDLSYVGATFSPLNGIFERPTSNSAASNGFYGVSFQVSSGDGGDIGVAYCAPGGPNSFSPGGGVLTSTGGYGTAGATFQISDVPDQPGLLFSGPDQINLPFGCGSRCVGGQVVRGDVLLPAGNSISATFDMIAAAGLDNIQFWYRDPANFACGSSFNLSNALRKP